MSAYSAAVFTFESLKVDNGFALGMKKSSPESLLSCAQTPNPVLSGCANSSVNLLIACRKVAYSAPISLLLVLSLIDFSIRSLLKVAYIFIHID